MKKTITFFASLFICIQFLAAQNGVIITPNAGAPASQLSVTLTGINTQFRAGTYTMQFFDQGTTTNKIEASNFQITSPNTLEASVFIKGSATNGAYDFNLKHTVQGTIYGRNQFHVGNPNNAPKITRIHPNVGGLNQNLSVSISGYNTKFTQGSQGVTFYQNGSPTSNITINGINAINDSLLQVELFIQGSASRGFYDIVIGNFFNFFWEPQSFEVTWASGTEEQEMGSTELQVYPNPAIGQINIQSKNTVIEKVEIIDMLGRLVQTEIPVQPTQKTVVEISAFVIPKQQYIIKVYTSKGITTNRILIN